MIFILGGTTEGKEIAQLLQRHNIPCMLSVATPLGHQMAGVDKVLIVEGHLHSGHLIELVKLHQIRIILDATHPYALEIKEIARQVAQEFGLLYCRYERETTPLPKSDNIVIVPDHQAAVEFLATTEGGILFTVGVKQLHLYQSLWREQSRPIWVKIYPVIQSLQICNDLNLRTEQIFAFHGTGDLEMLKVMIKSTGVSWIVTKESGPIGGTDLKIAAALELNRKILLIQRPSMKAEIVFHNYNEVMQGLTNRMC